MIGFAVLPALWVISASLNPAKSLAGASLFPNNPSFVNYDDLINHPSYPFETWLFNSIKITVIAVTLTVAITVLAGYALSRFRFAGKRAFMNGILILNVFPAVLTVIALFGMMQEIGTQVPWLGLDSHWGLIAIYVSFGLGINVLLVKRYIDRLPTELDESALIDGASHGRVFRSIVFPLILPIIATLPVLLLYIPVQKYVISGLTSGAMRG
jgi:arabinogalactan oligomer / maltooligosaccharide transport system permease protein